MPNQHHPQQPTAHAPPLASGGDLHRGAAIRIAGIFFGIGIAWIWLTDVLLVWSGAQTGSGFLASASKGTLFVCLSTPFVYWLVRRGFREVDRANALLRAVTNGTTDAIFVKDQDGKYLLFNQSAARLVGKPVAEVLGRDDTALFDPASAIVVMARDRRVMERGQAETEEEELTAAGVTRVYLSTKAPYRDESGNIAGVIGISHDITERKRSQNAIREGEAFARGVLNSMASHIAVLDSSGAIIAVNESWKSFAVVNPGPNGLSPRTGIGTNYLQVCDESASRGCTEAAAAVAGFRQVLEGIVDCFSLEYPCHAPTEQRWYSMSVTRLDHDSAGLVVSHTNISARKLAEEESRRAQEMLRLVLDNIPQGVFWKDRDSRFMGCNRVVARAMGLATPDEIVGRSHADLSSITLEQAAQFVLKDREVMESGAGQRHIIETMTLADGRTIWLDTNKVPMHDADGNVFGVLGTWEDITDRKRDEEALRYQHALLESQAEASPDGILVVGPEYRVRSYNRRFLDIWGIPEDVVAAGDDMPVLALARSRTADPDGFAARVAEIYGAPELRSHDEVALADGRTLERYSGPIRGDVGERFGRVWYFRDITKRKTAEEARSLLVAIVQSADEAIVSADTHGIIRSWNPAAERLFGYTPQEAIGKSNFELIVPPDRMVESRQRVERVMRGEHLTPLETVRLRKGSEAVHVSVSLSAVNLEGRVVGLSAIYQDISERKRVEEDLRDRERLLNIVTSSARVGLVVVNDQYEYLFANEAYTEIFGLRANEIVGRRVSDLLPAGWSQIQPRLDRALAGERVEYELTLPPASGKGVQRHFRAMYEPRTGDTEKPTVVVVVMEITEHKRAEAAIRESEARFRNVFENAPTGIGITDSDGIFLQGNPAYRAVLGLSEDELRAAELEKLIHPDDRAENMSLLRQLAAGEITRYEVENRFLHKTGRPVWVHKLVSALRDEAGRATHLMALVTDVTDRRRADQELRESEERYRRLIDFLPAAVFINTGGRISFCNPACVRLFGANEPAQILEKSPFDLFPADTHDVLRRRIADISASGRAAPGIEIRALRLDGRAVPVYSVATPILKAGVPAILVVLTDLTERERSMDLLRSVLGSVNDAILTIDEHGTVQSANPATEQSFGYSEVELLGKNVKVLMPEPYQGEHDGYIAHYLDTGEKKVIGIGREVEGRRKDGTTFPLELTVTEFRLDEKVHFTGVVRDITARKRLEAQFQQAQKMEAVGRLAGGVAHDFNNLLTVINGYSDIVLDTLPADDPQREFIASIREAGDRAARLTQQLLAFSRKAIIEPKILDLNELVAESAKLLRRLIGEDIALAVLPDPVPVRIKADPGQLEQVVMNLAVNARDAMPTGGRLTVETREVTIGDDDTRLYPGVKPGRYARLKVADTGCGMTEEVKRKIFEPFFTTKGVGKGTGLGLAVVHGVVEQCGGHIVLDSTVGVGTTFTLLFPIAIEAIAGPESNVLRIGARGTETVLLVEDEVAVRTIARIALSMQGYSVLEVERGADAIRLAADHPGPIHLLVTDVVMPEIGGRQLAEAVRTCRPEVRVLYMSGYTDDAVVRHGVESTDAFIQKPFTPLGLARKVRAVLDGSA